MRPQIGAGVTAGHIQDRRQMPRRGEKTLEITVRENGGRRVDRRMRLDGGSIPQLAIGDEIDGVRLVVDQREQADRSARDAQMLAQPLRT